MGTKPSFIYSQRPSAGRLGQLKPVHILIRMFSMLVQRLVTVRWVRMDSALTGPKLFQYAKRSSW